MYDYTAFVAGIDLGDRVAEVCVYGQGVVMERFTVAMTPGAFHEAFVGRPFARVALEAGAQSAWVTRELRAAGQSPVVANPRKLKAIFANERKSDRNDALLLAKLASADASLLHPIEHRSEERDAALAVLKARDTAVRGRARLVHTIRSLGKSIGFRFTKGTVEGFANREAEVPEALASTVTPLFTLLRCFNEQIAGYDAQVEDMAKRLFPEAQRVQQVHGVGAVTALAFVLVLETPARFPNGRAAAAFVGLVPRRDQSGKVDRQLPISKTGSSLLRRLLVQCAQYILGPFGVDSDLRRWGHKLAARGGKNAKKRAVVAAARRLAVLLFRLWKHGEVWQALYQANRSSPPPVVDTSVEDGPNARSVVTAPDALSEPPPRNDVREIAAPAAGSDPTMHPAENRPTKSADRSVSHGTASTHRTSPTETTPGAGQAHPVGTVPRSAKAPRHQPATKAPVPKAPGATTFEAAHPTTTDAGSGRKRPAATTHARIAGEPSP